MCRHQNINAIISLQEKIEKQQANIRYWKWCLNLTNDTIYGEAIKAHLNIIDELNAELREL